MRGSHAPEERDGVFAREVRHEPREIEIVVLIARREFGARRRELHGHLHFDQNLIAVLHNATQGALITHRRILSGEARVTTPIRAHPQAAPERILALLREDVRRQPHCKAALRARIDRAQLPGCIVVPRAIKHLRAAARLFEDLVARAVVRERRRRRRRRITKQSPRVRRVDQRPFGALPD